MPLWAIILLSVLGVLVVLFIALIIFGRHLQKRQDEQNELMETMKQTVSMLIIDKKRLKLSEAGFPKQVYDQMPKYTRRMKMPIVKAKVGPKVMTLMCDQKVFEMLPVKTEVKAVVSGIYITDVRGVRGNTIVAPKKKKLLDRFKKTKKDVKEKK